MAVLTSRDVDAADRSRSMRGIGFGSRLLGTGCAGLRTRMSGVETARTADADQAVMLEALKYSDPAAYQEALASGAITGGVNPQRLSTEAIKGLGTRADTLLTQSIKNQALDQANYTFGRTKDGNARLDAATPAINDVLIAAARGDQEAAARGINSTALGGLLPDQLGQLGTNVQGLLRG